MEKKYPQMLENKNSNFSPDNLILEKKLSIISSFY